jgi:hypothetical protein
MSPLIFVTQYPHDPNRACAPAALLREMASAGALRHFEEASSPEANTDGLGNCHEAALALMTDLIVAGKDSGWHWATGRTLHGIGPAPMSHSWLECDGWAFDVAAGKILALDVWDHRRSRKARNVRLRNARETQGWVESRCP